MSAPEFRYRRATTAGDALAMSVAAPTGSRYLAGGQSLLPALRARRAAPPELIDVARIPELRGVRLDADHLDIGACTRYDEAAGSPDVRAAAPLLAAAILAVGDRQIRAMGTLGGSIGNADPAADVPAALLALDARCVVQGVDGRRELPLARLYRAEGGSALGRHELLCAVRVPIRPGAGWWYEKHKPRAHDWATVAVAVCLADRPAVALAGMGPTPIRAAAVEEALAGGSAVADAADEAVVGTAAVSDGRASAGYRRHLAPVLVRRALEKAGGSR
jgi:carbon-monoxide dehydrogenase medium subunit